MGSRVAVRSLASQLLLLFLLTPGELRCPRGRGAVPQRRLSTPQSKRSAEGRAVRCVPQVLPG